MFENSSIDYQSGMESLHGNSNFYAWKAVVRLHLESLDLWNITCGSRPRPTSPSPDTPLPTPTLAQKAWDRDSLLARCFLERHMSEEINRQMSVYETAPAMWQALMKSYLQRNAHSLLRSFNALNSLRYSDTSPEPFAEYLASFERHWNDLYFRTGDADPPTVGAGNSLETGLRVIATSDESKRELLIASLPTSMQTFVADLMSRHGSEVTYNHLYRYLIDFHQMRELHIEESAVEEL